MGARLLDALPDRTLTLFAQGFQRDGHRGPDQAGDRREVVDVHAVLAQESAAVLVDHATVDPDHGVPPDRVLGLAIIAVDLQPCAVLHEDLALLQLALERLANPRRGVGGQPCRGGELIEGDRRLALGVEELLDPLGEPAQRPVQVVRASGGRRDDGEQDEEERGEGLGATSRRGGHGDVLDPESLLAAPID